ncbi:MAG: DUF3842 family protein [Clostridiales bacterium]|nr:DUF3842 family protein [Clostridiales bacterium]
MKIMIIDGQGGKIGKLIVESLKKSFPEYELMAFGTNSIATSVMLKAGADIGATGENPVIFNSQDADAIIGPIGIVLANSLLGEITPAMAQAVSQSKARKILIPINKCNTIVAGTKELPLNDYIQLAVQQLKQFLES